MRGSHHARGSARDTELRLIEGSIAKWSLRPQGNWCLELQMALGSTLELILMKVVTRVAEEANFGLFHPLLRPP